MLASNEGDFTMTEDQNAGSGSADLGSISSNNQGISDQRMDLGVKTGEAVSKLAQAVQQAGGQAKETATSLASEAAEKTKGLLNHQVEAGADFVSDIAQAVNVAADSLDPNSPQLAELVRGVAQHVNEFSESVRGQSVQELFETTSDFVRRNPALVFGAATACGFLLFRVIRASPSDGLRPERRQGNLSAESRAQQAAGDGGNRFQNQPSGEQGQASPFHGA
jgi:ElaB/YqjD/DUF883 family membrane-anchored ribosome-binding protein